MTLARAFQRLADFPQSGFRAGAFELVGPEVFFGSPRRGGLVVSVHKGIIP